MSLRRLRQLSEILGWMALGLGTGLTMGVLMGQRGEAGPARPPAASRRSGRVGSPAQALRARLTEALGDLDLTVQAVGPRTVELLGWVESDDRREEIMRFARAQPGIRNVHDRLRVHGEDDLAGTHPSPPSPAP